eukprot:TRINITY_DN1422_c0_g1_i1.p1 TRINITY_DN1422_c0_g1~~TRINITY_DN1422_c0_g1_i1.p1  ORF type:complete len:118 (+),score=26.40 TRINITY_DN1422_c0_g1_i1:57-410(+)
MKKATPPQKTSNESFFAKALAKDVEWEKDDLFNVVHWVRQIVAVILGLVWGIIPLQGIVGVMSFLLLNPTIMFTYYTKYLGVDDEEMGRTELIQEGFMSSFGLFLVCWITSYNIIHF